ncbi:CHASE3 domain-containing protein, partial [Clostridioides difficile]|uniref:CHASE3 domain-containing protein n=1 Tax=Clostridioides difficile TaxID=1496 RepID=UPI0013040F28
MLGVSSMFGVHKLIEASQLVDHSNQVIDSTQELAFNLADTTASERAYLITEQEIYYQRYRDGSEKTMLSLTKLAETLSDNKVQQERLNLLRAIVKERIEAFDITTDMFRTGNKAGALERVRVGKGIVFMTKIQALMDEFRQEEFKL